MLKNKIASQIQCESFPTTYALKKFIELKLQPHKTQVLSSPLSALEPIISLKEYSEKSGQPSSRPPIFLIMLESISSDHVGFNGYPRNVTPNLDALAKDSLIYSNAYAPSNTSNYAQTSISSSQYARRRRQLDMFNKIDYPKTLLFDVLGHYGYETAGSVTSFL